MQELLERQTVLAELTRLVRRVARGTGQMVLLRGEAGVGKTAVIARFSATVHPPTRLLRGWCDPLDAPRPLGPLMDALAGLGGAASGLAAAVDEGDVATLYARLLEVLADGRRWVWVIEDAHWADGATLDLLRFLARRIESLPLLLVVSYRDDELDGQHPLAVALGDIATCAAVHRIGLAPLSRDAVAALAVGSGHNADRLYRLTGGNPFFVTEVLAADPDAMGSDALPRSISEAVRGRLARLSGPARETAQAVAVCAPRADPALVRQVCPQSTTGLAECLDAGVLVADADTVGFRHELARRATLDTIADHRRRALHARALAALAQPPADPETLGALAFHAGQTGDHEAVIRYAPPAAERAASLGAHSEAAELYALTLSHAGGFPVQQQAIWLEKHALSSYVCGLSDASAQSFREAIALRHALGDRLAEGDDLRWLSYMLWPLGRNAEALQAGRESLRLLEDMGPGPQLAWSLVNMAELTAYHYDPACLDYAARALRLGTELGDHAVTVRARFFPALAAATRSDTGWEQMEAAWRDAMADDATCADAGITGAALCWAAALHHRVDAERYISETAVYCADHDLDVFLTIATGAGALVALHRGDWAGAAARADDVLTRPALTSLHRIMPLVSVALIRARRGEQAAAAPLDEALSTGEPGDLFRLGVVWAARAEAAWLAGDDDAARAEARTGLAAATDRADAWLVGHLQRWLRLAGGSVDDAPTGAVTPYHLEIAGDWRAAAAEWTRLGCPYDAAVAQLAGDLDAVQAALTTFRKLGARAAARRARHRLAELRGRPASSRRADTLADPDGLTRREREVLALLADGRSDAQIAAALHISPKTAGCHVSSILAKLGVDNRIQAAAHAFQRQGAAPV